MAVKQIRVLVTGGTGFIGCNMVAFLKKKGYWVRVADISVADRVKQRGVMFKQADEVREADLRKMDDVEWVMEGIDWVFHFASDMGGVGFFNKYNYYPFMNNMRIDMNILDACEKFKVKKLFYSSSSCIYPEHLQMEEGKADPLKEDMIYPAQADQNYGWEKLMMTRLMEEARRLHKIDARVGIFSTFYGPYQEVEGERMKFPTAISTRMLKAQKTKKPVEVWGNGKQLRSYLYIDDGVEMIYRIMTMKYHGPVNVASEHMETVDETAKMVGDIIGFKPKIKHNLRKPSGVLARASNMHKFYRHYKYHPKISSREGFTRLIRWIQN